jgi:regulator of sirC expression with transglutaminase-like and TPR domain
MLLSESNRVIPSRFSSIELRYIVFPPEKFRRMPVGFPEILLLRIMCPSEESSSIPALSDPSIVSPPILTSSAKT